MERRALVALFALGLASFALAFGAGTLRSLRAEGQLPAVDGSYAPFIQELIDREALDGALRQLRVAATLDFERRRLLVPMVAGLAREIGDADSEVWALRQMLRRSPNPELRQRLDELEGADR